MVCRTMIVSAMLVAGALCLASASKSEPTPIRQPFMTLPSHIGAWGAEGSSELDPSVLKKLGVDDYVNTAYSDAERNSVGLYIGYYRSQRQGDTMHSPLNCLPGAGWNPVERGMLSIAVEPETATMLEGNQRLREITINRILIQQGLSRKVVLYWYQSHGRVVASEYWAKIYTVVDAIRTNRTDAALVRVICPVSGTEEGDIAAAEQKATDFVKSLFPLLGNYLPN